VENDEVPIFCEVDVEFHRIGAQFLGALEGGDSVLGALSRGTPMANQFDVLWHLREYGSKRSAGYPGPGTGTGVGL
jgi:hypothetical protein